MFKLIGLSFVIGITFLMTFTFVFAFFSPDKMIILNIDRYGEANLEMIILVLLFPMAVYYFIHSIDKV
ncbi:MAG TPA: hypothetical protein VJB11_00465 [archaeon]|nr:hypothetical protein [archaeon]